MLSTTKRFFGVSRSNVVIVGAKRTPIGSFMGALSALNGPTLGKIAAIGAIESANVDPADIEEVYMGNVLQAGVGQAPARQVALGANCGADTPSTTINKVCASGMKAAMMAAQAIALGEREVMLAGGMECMSKAPHYMYMRTPTGFGNGTAVDSIQFDGLTDVYNSILMGSCVEKTCSEMGITREMQDEYAIESYNRARAAQEAGLFDWETVDVIQQTRKGEVKFSRDEECRKFMPDKFPGLKPAFAKNGTITAANASKINDGAACMVLMSEEAAKKRGLKPLARLMAWEDAACAPIDFSVAPSKACTQLLKKAGLNANDVDFHEVNEAFAAVPRRWQLLPT